MIALSTRPTSMTSSPSITNPSLQKDEHKYKMIAENVTVTLPDYQQPDFKLFDISGKEINALTVNTISNQTFEIELNQLNSGVYYIGIYEENEMRISKKVVVAKN
mgnify:CR=1 FL=1